MAKDRHSAMFQFGSKESAGDITLHILGYTPRAEGGTSQPRIDLVLCGEKKGITFYEDHFLELQAMTRESQSAGA